MSIADAESSAKYSGEPELHVCQVCNEHQTIALLCDHCRDRALAHLGWTINDMESMEDVMLVYHYADRIQRGELIANEDETA